MKEIFEIIQQPFIITTLINLNILAILFSLIGVFLTLKNKSFFVSGIAHASLLGIAIGIFLGQFEIIFALTIGSFMAILVTYFSNKKLNLDATIGIFYSFLFAIGLFLINLKPDYTTNLFGYLFGSILLISKYDTLIIGILFLIFVSILILFYEKLVYATFDPQGAYVRGIKVNLIEYFINIFSAIAIIIAIKLIGIILISGILIIPASIAKITSKNFKQLFFYSPLFSIISANIAFVISLKTNVPLSSLIVIILGTLFITINLFSYPKWHKD